jgi:hypothetical protein
MIIIAKAFPDEGGKDEPPPRFHLWNFPIPEIATAELGVDANWYASYWKINLLNMHFLLWDRKIDECIFDFEITPFIISKNKDIPSYNLSFANLRISYFILDELFFTMKPFLEINYLFLKDSKFDFNTINLQAGIRFGTFSFAGVEDSLYFETGYAYKNNRHNYFFTIGISPLWAAPPFPSV